MPTITRTNLSISGISGKTGYVAFAAEKTGIGEDLQMRSDFLDVFAKKVLRGEAPSFPAWIL